MILNVFIYIYIMCIYIHSTFYVYYMLYSVLKFSIFLRCVRFLHWIESPDSSFFVIWGTVRSQDSRGHQWWLRLTVFKSTSSRSPSPKKITKWYQVFKVTKKQLEMGKWKIYMLSELVLFRNIFVCRFRRPFFPTGDAVDADESRWSATEVADGWMEDVYRGPSQNGSMKNRILPIGSLPSHISRHNSCWLNKLWCCSRCKCNFGPARVCLKRELLLGRNCDVLHVED